MHSIPFFRDSLTARMFWKVFPAQLAGLLIININGMIDSLITSNALGPIPMAAIGLFAPIGNLIALFYVFNTGALIKCSEYAGRGNPKKAGELFSTCVLFQLILGAAVGAAFLIFAEQIARFAGADQDTLSPLAGYIRAYGVGIAGILIFNLLLSFLQLNNMLRWSYISMIIMMIVNTSLNLLFALVFKLGLFGMGLATSISNIAAALVVIHCFTRKKKLTVRLRFGVFRIHELMNAARLGLPHFVFNIGVIIKSAALNITLITLGSQQALAVMAVHNTVCSFIGMLPAAVSSVTLMLGCIFFGEENSATLKSLFKYALKTGVIITAGAAIIVTLLSGPISSAYYRQGTELWEMTKQMLLAFPVFIVFNVVFFVCVRIHQTTGHINAANVFSFLETVLCGAFFWLLSTKLGIGGAWHSYSMTDITCLLLMAGYVFIRNRRVTFRALDWLLLDENRQFAPPDKRLDITLTPDTTIDSLYTVVNDFVTRCIHKPRISNLLLLCLEEIVTDISERNAIPNGSERVNIHVASKTDTIKVLVRDNCILSDPSERIRIFDPEAPLRNVEVRIVAGMAKKMTYQCILGMNVLYLEI